MTSRDLSFSRGRAAAQRPGVTVATVEIPMIYTTDQKARFLSGFLVGAQEKRAAEVEENGRD